MAEMGLDLWYFQGLSADDGRRLSEHLETHFRLDFQVVSDPRGACALFVSRSSGLLVEPITPPSVGPVARRKGKGSGTGGRGSKPRPCGTDSTWSSSSSGLWVRLSPLGRRPVDLWLRPSACAEPGAIPREITEPGPEADTVIVTLGRTLSAGDLRAWRTSGRPILAAASSQNASVLLLPGEPSSIESIFLTANTVPLLIPSSESLTVVRDRGFPETTRLVSSLDPLAIRLVLGDPKPVRGSAVDPLSLLDPDLERALKDLLTPIVARLAGELRLPQVGG